MGLRKRAVRLRQIRRKEDPPPPPPPTPPPTPPPPTCDEGPIETITDYTKREGLGESPGIPNLEYLGIGYNIFEGNPRGSDISEADPGFRSGVIQLVQKQTELTIDQDYMVPLGVDLRYITACKFASKSTELSNENEYQEEISREATQETDISGGIGGMFSISASYAFSSSEKYKQFTETTAATQSVTYEARALCSEFKAALKPYYTHTLKEEFEMALDALSTPWTNSDEQRKEYADFLSAFGTHYVKDVTLGAKHIYSSEIKSEDVSSLKKNDVDIQSTLSWSVQASFNGGGSASEELQMLPRFEASGEIPGLGEAKIYKYIFEEASVGAGVSNSESISEAESKSNLEQVKTKVTTINELNIGGNPPEDGNWKTWATTVRDRPMPISYELAGIWTLMNSKQTKAFEEAVVALYNLDLRAKKDGTIIDALRFGVTRGNGEAISSYNRSPSSNYRSSIEFTAIPGGETQNEITENIVKTEDKELDVEHECGEYEPNAKGGRWQPIVTRDDPTDTTEYFACGMQVETIEADQGITGLHITFCDLNNWDTDQVEKQVFSQTRYNNKDVTPSKQTRKFCPKDQYIIGVKVKADESDWDQEGVNSLWIRCSPKVAGAQNANVKELNVWYDSEGSDEFTKDRSESNTFLTGAGVRECQGLGIFGMYLQFSAPREGGSRFASYEYDVSREGDDISAIFATPVRGSIGKNTEEDENELGFAIGSKFNVISYYPFGIFDRFKAKISIQDFADTGDGVVKELQSFSFLSGKNLPANADYVAGVVHPDGYAVNENFSDDDISFEISQSSAREYRIDLGTMKNPTFLAFPLWFPGSSESFPSSLGSVAVATKFCGVNYCDVVTGAPDSEIAKKKLGFSFIAINGPLLSTDVSGIVHDRVNVNSADLTVNGNRFNGFEIESVFTPCANGRCNLDGVDGAFTGKTGGFLIKFKERFRGLPSVIVNPIISPNRDLAVGEGNKIKLPYAVVEHVTETSAFVKVYWLDTYDLASPIQSAISFHIVAVGPQRNPYSDYARII